MRLSGRKFFRLGEKGLLLRNKVLIGTEES